MITMTMMKCDCGKNAGLRLLRIGQKLDAHQIETSQPTNKCTFEANVLLLVNALIAFVVVLFTHARDNHPFFPFNWAQMHPKHISLGRVQILWPQSHLNRPWLISSLVRTFYIHRRMCERSFE